MTPPETPDLLPCPYIDPMFGLGDVVTVVGKYAGDWRGQKLLITGLLYSPKKKTVTYQTHPADDPTSEGGTDEWPEDDLSLYRCNKYRADLVTRTTSAPSTAAGDCPFTEKQMSDAKLFFPCGIDQQSVLDWFKRHGDVAIYMMTHTQTEQQKTAEPDALASDWIDAYSAGAEVLNKYVPDGVAAKQYRGTFDIAAEVWEAMKPHLTAISTQRGD